jgi:enoyl-CoA hydratase
MVQTSSQPDVVVGRTGSVGLLELNRPRAINALTLEMVEILDAALAAWEVDSEISCVLLRGAGERGFCAGGDIVMMRDSVLAAEPQRARAFWRGEYLLDARLARYPKPVVVAMDGIVMGGGVGLGGHASHRLVTERSIVAMPEVGIGLHPDCGVAYLLARAPGELGTHLTLTGDRIDGANAVLCGLADRVVSAAALAELPVLLAERGVEAAVAALPEPEGGTPAPSLVAERDWIDAAYRGDSVGAVLGVLRGRQEPGAAAAAATIATRSPTSLNVSFRALRNAREMTSLEQCFDQDYRVSTACATDADLVEGIRATVVDKDFEPRWNPPDLAAVDEAEVARHFEPVVDELGLAASPESGSAAG